MKISQGINVLQICREMEIAEQTYYRWLQRYGFIEGHPDAEN
ncbi:MAG TPA: helix-turn-helix domain-containing protein [Syntrophales bacterium]|nr:helix-turn-helix domain-containing protein [Syntrophales bacterium]